MSDTTDKALLGLGGDGGPARRAAEALDSYGFALSAAVRRSVPFVSRQGVPVLCAPAIAATMSEILADLSRPTFVTWLTTAPGGARAAIVLDATAMAFLLVGMLGGDSNGLPALDPEGLSAPQRALLSRLVDGVVGAVSPVFAEKAGFRFQKLPNSSGDAPTEVGFVALPMSFGEKGQHGRMLFVISKDAMMGATGSASSSSSKNKLDDKVVATLGAVELELVAELGRVRLTLGELTDLRIGDTLRTDVPISAAIGVRAETEFLLAGVPTTSGSQIAIRIVARDGEAISAA